MGGMNKKLIRNYNKGYFVYPANIIIHTVIKMVLKNSRKLRVHVSCGESTGELASESKHVLRGNSCPDVYRGDSADC